MIPILRIGTTVCFILQKKNLLYSLEKKRRFRATWHRVKVVIVQYYERKYPQRG
jgi:hypothetical protein